MEEGLCRKALFGALSVCVYPEVHYWGFFMAVTADEKFMTRALELAIRAKGRTSPNPLVGAVIVKEDEIISEGFHGQSGIDHAEVIAINKAKKLGESLSGATIYVTLEPCSHTGRTGPCTDALIESGIKRVVVAIIDPDRRVKGRGIKRLTEAGVEVNLGVLAAEASKINEPYLMSQKLRRPFVVLKSAQTLDGRTATLSGESMWISGERSRHYGHQLRAECDAIIVGSGTVTADDPSLTVRHVKGKNPYRIVLSNNLVSLKHSRLVQENKDFKTILVSSADSIELFLKQRKKPQVMLWEVGTIGAGRLNLHEFMFRAKEFGFRSLLVEGGATLATSFWKEQLVDKYFQFTAPIVIGTGKESLGDLGIASIVKAVRFSEGHFELCGRDSLFIGYPQRRR